MATKYSIDVCADGEWETIALFSDVVPLSIMTNCARDTWDNVENASDVAVLDMDTGEILYSAAAERDYEPADIDDDCGFNPYEGCYDYDC